MVDICNRRVLIDPELFFRTGGRSKHHALPFSRSSLCDPDVKMNDVQRFTPFASPVLWSSIASRVIPRVQATFAIKTKSDSERHQIPQQSPREPGFPLSAWASPNKSEAGISLTAMKEQRPFTGTGRSSSIR